MNTEQLTEACGHLLELLDAREQNGRCNVCDTGKRGRFVHFDDGEVACEDCVKTRALLAMEYAKCSVG